MAVENMTSNEQPEMEELSDEELAAQEEAQEKARKQEEETLASLGEKIEAKFYDRAKRRANKEKEWKESMTLYLGNLSVNEFVNSNQPFTSTERTNRPYHNVVANKCDIAIAQSVDMQFAGGEKNWSITASEDNSDPLAANGARLMEKEITSQLERCYYGKKCRRAIEDRVILGTGIVKGPSNTGKLYTRYVDVGGGVWAPEISINPEPTIDWVNPWFFYPDDTVNDFQHCSDAIEVHPYSPFELSKLRKHPGFKPEAIDTVLKQAPSDYIEAHHAEYRSITDSNPYLFKDKYTVLEYHGPITVDDMMVLGIEPTYDSPSGEYYGEVWVCQGTVIRIQLENIEGAFEIPYSLSAWKRDPSSVFGFGSPLLMKDAQRVARETWRMILDNAAISSGPQVAMHKTYVEPANGEWVFHPLKAWHLLDASVDVQKAIQFFNVPNVSEQLIPILELSRKFAEEESMTPMLIAGVQGADAVDSATGSLMMKEASTTVLDFLSEDWDDNVTEKVIRRMYAWNMQYNPKPEIKGNYSIDVRTSTEYKNKQMHVRDLERLSVEAAQNPSIAMMLNMDELYRARLSMMHLPYSTIVKSVEEVQAAQQAASQQPDPAQVELQIKMMEAQTAQEILNLKKMELAFNAQQQQQREAWEHEEKMAANYARTLEAEAMVIRSQNEKETEFVQLAARMEEGDKKNNILASIAVMNNETKKFTAMLEDNAKARQELLVANEQRIKMKTGSGI